MMPCSRKLGLPRSMSWEQNLLVQHPSTLHVFVPCMLHQNAKVVGSSCQHLSRKLVSGLYSHAKLLRMGSYFLRTILAVEAVIASNLQIIYGHAPEADLETQEQVASMLWPSFAEVASEAQRTRRAELMEEFRMLFNSNPFGPLIHYCRFQRCHCQDRGHTVQRMVRLLLATAYKRRPPPLKRKNGQPCMKPLACTRSLSSCTSLVTRSSNVP